MRFRLRYLHHDLELTEGEFAVGRNASCQLSLDDPLVSRRHALLRVTSDAVSVEDLASRNGVLVNGNRIDRMKVLAPGDRITIGGQELTVLLGKDSGAQPSTGHFSKMTLPRVPVAEGATAVHGDSLTTSDYEVEQSMVRRADAFNLLGSVAEKALAMGKVDDAERILASPLGDVIEASRAGKTLTPNLVDMAAKFSARLATATGKATWFDYVLELYAREGRPSPANVIDELYAAIHKVSGVDLGRLRAYVADLRPKLPSYGPAERFLFQRLEGLERLAALR